MATQSVIGFTLAVGGFAALSYGLWTIWLASSSTAWSRTDGVILQASIRSYRDLAGGVGMETYRPLVRYRYTAEGTEHEGTRVAFGDFVRTQFRTPVAQMVATMPPGATVPVFYDPSMPRRAVLQPGRNWAVYVVPTIALLPLIVGLLFLLE